MAKSDPLFTVKPILQKGKDVRTQEGKWKNLSPKKLTWQKNQRKYNIFKQSISKSRKKSQLKKKLQPLKQVKLKNFFLVDANMRLKVILPKILTGWKETWMPPQQKIF